MEVRFVASALAGLVLLAVPAPARANGRFPASNQVLVAPSDPNFLVLRTTFGVLVSSDAGKNWDVVCEKAVGYGGTEDPSLALTGGGTILGGTFEGLSTSRDKGCNWAFVPGPLTQNVVVDLVVRPDTPSTALVLTNKFSGTDDAGASLFQSDIFSSTNDGQTWATIGPALDRTIVFETVEVAKSDPQRLYVSGVRGAGPTEKGVVLSSKNAGQSWTENAVPLDTATERAPFISAVDPKNADRVYVRTKGTAGSRLLVSDDGGGTYKEVLKFGGDMLGFALSGDGAKIFVGGPKDGLYVGDPASLAFAQVSKIAVQCLSASGSKLFACSSEVAGFIVGVSEDDGKSFTGLLHLCGVRGPLACGPTSSEAQCLAGWPALQDSLGGSCIDAGAADSGDDGGTSSSGGSSSGGGCILGGADAGVGAGAAAAALAATLLFARRRRVRPRTRPSPRAR